MVVPWPIVAGIVGPTLAMVGIGVGVLRMSPPDFSAGRGWFWGSALWMMLASVAAYLTTTPSSRNALILCAFELAVAWVLVRGLRWVNYRERLHSPSRRAVVKQTAKPELRGMP